MIYDHLVEPLRNYRGEIIIYVGAFEARKCHPFRNGYELRIPMINNLFPKTWSTRDTSPLPLADARGLESQHYNLVWYLSKVSHQVREEIGRRFWSNIHVTFHGSTTHINKNFILNFLQNCPAVRTGIGSIDLAIKCHDDDISEVDWITIEILEYFSEHLVLDDVQMALMCRIGTVRRILSSGDQLGWVKAFRKLNTKRLNVFIWPFGDEVDESAGYDSEKEDQEREEKKRLTSAMEKFLHRSVSPTVEIAPLDEYLQARAKLLD